MVSNQIIIGTDSYDDDKIAEGNCYVTNGIIAEELGIDTMDITVLSNTALKYPYGTEVKFYHNESLLGKLRVNTVSRVGKQSYKINCISDMGILDNLTHYGGIYNGETADVVADDIIGGAISYSMSKKVASIKIYGWLPVASRRANLHQLLFATGAALKKDTAGIASIVYLSDKSPVELSDDRIGMGGSIEYIDAVTSVSVTEHGYIKTSGDEVVTLYDGTVQAQDIISPKGAALNGALITWNDPVYDLAITSGTILEFGVNYAVISSGGQAELTGKKYTHTRQDILQAIEGAAGEENVLAIENATLVNVTNSTTVARRFADYYSKVRYVTFEMEVGEERPGDAIHFSDPFDEESTGLLMSQDINLSNTLLADAKIAVGYTPESGPTVFNKADLLTEDGQWTVPEGVTTIRVVLIGGGTGGYPGFAGEKSKTQTPETEYSKVTDSTTRYVFVVWVEAGDGGNGGAGGSGGKIYQRTLSVIPGQTFQVSIGKGGAGAAFDASAETPPAGTDGGETIFGDLTSAAGAASAAGFIETLSGKIYGAAGKTGIAGSKGHYKTYSKDTGWVDVPSPEIIVDGVTYTQGANGPEDEDGGGDWGNTSYGYVGWEYNDAMGGGPAYGANGLNGGKGRGSYNSSRGYARATAGDGGTGATALPPPAETVYGTGGTGGNGGGGGGSPGRAAAHQTTSNRNPQPSASLTAIGGEAGMGGDGSNGGTGAPGCAIVYYNDPSLDEENMS